MAGLDFMVQWLAQSGPMVALTLGCSRMAMWKRETLVRFSENQPITISTLMLNMTSEEFPALHGLTVATHGFSGQITRI